MIVNILGLVLSIIIVIMLVLSFLPWWHETLATMTQDWDSVLRFLVLFIFDPLEYVWKWIVGLLITVILLSRRQ